MVEICREWSQPALSSPLEFSIFSIGLCVFAYLVPLIYPPVFLQEPNQLKYYLIAHYIIVFINIIPLRCRAQPTCCSRKTIATCCSQRINTSANRLRCRTPTTSCHWGSSRARGCGNTTGLSWSLRPTSRVAACSDPTPTHIPYIWIMGIFRISCSIFPLFHLRIEYISNVRRYQGH